MTDESLIERLRKGRRRYDLETGGGTISVDGRSHTYSNGEVWQRVNPDGPEAAAALQSQEARIQELVGALGGCLAREREWAKLRGLSDCSCMALSRDAEREYETEACPHQLGRDALASARNALAEGGPE